MTVEEFRQTMNDEITEYLSSGGRLTDEIVTASDLEINNVEIKKVLIDGECTAQLTALW